LNESFNQSFLKAHSNPSTEIKNIPKVTLIGDLDIHEFQELLNKYQLTLRLLDQNQAICGSFWGESEAGLIDNTVYVRVDTPIHSLLHESCHYICMDEIRRNKLDTNAEGDYDEENAVCYLQILLANNIKGFSSELMMQDMDSWGYTFRLGSARAWFDNDAEDALAWLQDKQLLNQFNQPNFSLRKT